MARSQYIYVVYDMNSMSEVAAFTVKHEALAAIKRHGKGMNLQLCRVSDGKWDSFNKAIVLEIQ